MLTFTEELFLLLHYSAKKGAIVELHPNTSALIVSGGILVELLLANRLRLDEQSLVVTDARATGDEVLDAALTSLAPAQPREPNNPEWVDPIAQRLPSAHRLFGRLLEKGILRREEKRALFGLSRSIIYPLDPATAQQLIERVLNVMVRGAKPDPHSAALLFMTGVWGHSDFVELSGKEKKAYRKRWDDLFGDYWGLYTASHEMEPIEGLDPAIRTAIGDVTNSWVSMQATYVAADYHEWVAATA